MTVIQSKASQLREMMKQGDWEQAFRLAASFPRLDKDRSAILDARSAYTNPRFLLQIGKDIEAIKEAGKAALINRYPLQ